MGHHIKIGRPLKIESPEQMMELAQAHWDECEANNLPITVTGTAQAIGLYGREDLIAYQGREAFTDIVKKIKAGVVRHLEEHSMKARNPAGAIFILKNLGWSDRQDLNLTTPDGINLKFDPGRGQLSDEIVAKLLKIAELHEEPANS